MAEAALTPDELGEIASFARSHPGECETMDITSPRELLCAIRVQLKQEEKKETPSGS